MKLLSRMFFASFIFCLSASIAAQTLSGPSHSSNGSFSISWQPLDPALNCVDLEISAVSNRGYEESFVVDALQTDLDFYGLPSGVYTILLSGTCELGSAGLEWGETRFSALIITVSEDFEDSSEGFKGLAGGSSIGRSEDGILSEQKSYSLEGSISLLSTQQPSTFHQCGTICPSGSHSEATMCSEEIKHPDTNIVVGYCDGGLCYDKDKPVNSALCVTNSNDFWTCDISCPFGYDLVDQSWNSARCGFGRNFSNREIRCVINTSPPSPVTLDGPTLRYDARIEVTWGSVAHVGYYQWKFSNQSSWNRLGNRIRKVDVSGLASGAHTVQVRACNDYGCSAIRSRNVTLAAPNAPAISNGTSGVSGSFTLRWSGSAGASYYQWRQGSGSWQRVANNQVTMALSSGTYNFAVRACNSVDECGASGSKTITLTPPSAPTITNGSSSVSGPFTLTWSASNGATYYEWRRNDSNWTKAANTHVPMTLEVGFYNFSVRACNDIECGDSESKGISVVSVCASTGSIGTFQTSPTNPSPGAVCGMRNATTQCPYEVTRALTRGSFPLLEYICL